MFDFFGLSRELRDHIYGNLLDRDASLPTMKDFTMEVKNGPRISLMLLNRQFSSEYMDAMKRCTKIIFTDGMGQFWASAKLLQGLDVPLTLRMVRRLELRIWVAPDSGYDDDEPQDDGLHVDVERHKHWIGHIVSLMKNPEVSILVGLIEDDCGYADYIAAAPAAVKRLLCFGVARMILRRGNPKWKTDGDEKPHVIFRYDNVAKELVAVEASEDGKRETEKNFGFEDDDEESVDQAKTAHDQGWDDDTERNPGANREGEEEGEGAEEVGGNDERET